MSPRKVSLAIPHFNSSALLAPALEYAVTDERIAEIVVNDDASSSPEYASLSSLASRLGEKVRLRRNPRNLGILANKLEVVSRCASDWAILLDSDNCIDRDFVDALFALSWSPDTIYCPQFARPRFDFRHLAGRTIDHAEAARLLAEAVEPRGYRTFLNTGNYLVPVAPYVECVTPHAHADVQAADVIFVAWLWLSAGNRLHVVPGLEYDHRVRTSSSSAQWAGTSLGVAQAIGDALAAGEPYRARYHGTLSGLLLGLLAPLGVTRRHVSLPVHTAIRLARRMRGRARTD